MKKFVIVAAILLSQSVFAQHLKEYNVVLRSNVGKATMWDNVVMPIFGMTIRLSAEPTLPAPTLYCNEGDTLVLNALAISQGDHHSIHLHGMDADTKNDGDPATSFSLAHTQTFPYTVVANHAGTYIYHCHFTDVIHVQMGMYGLVIVRPKDSSATAWTGGPRYDKTVSWLFSELDSSWHKNIPKHDSIADTIHVPPYRPEYFLINGKSESQIAIDTSIPINASSGDEVYVRIANIGFFYNRVIFPSSVKARKIDSDGRPLQSAVIGDTIEVAPGERYGVMLTIPNQSNDVVRIEYVNMNSDSVWSTQRIPLNSASSGVRASLDPTVRIYPNPGHQTVVVEGIQPHSQYEFLDCLGRRVLFGIADEDGSIETQSLLTGTYFLRINSSLIRFVRSEN